MAEIDSLSDQELRRALNLKGVDVGPITGSTRKLYKDKLRRISGEGLGVVTSPPKCNRPLHELHEDNDDIDGPENKGTPVSSINVVRCMWSQLNNPDHVTSDTVVMFPDGELFYVCRGIIISVYEKLKPFFYNTNELYGVQIVSLTGSSLFIWTRYNENGRDLKEKISLKQGILINEIRLIYNQQEVLDEVSIGEQSIVAGSSIHIALIANPISPSPYPVSCILPAMSPSLSISHFVPSNRLDTILPNSTTQSSLVNRVVLKSHIQHILHVHNMPNAPFKILLGFLYSGIIPELPQQESAVLVLASCAILGEEVLLQEFTQMALYHLTSALKYEPTAVSLLLKHAESFPILKSCLIPYIKEI